MNDGFTIDGGKTITPKPCEDNTCFQKIISNGALEQCTVCGTVRDGETVRRLEQQIKAGEESIMRVRERMEELANIIVALQLNLNITPEKVETLPIFSSVTPVDKTE